MKKILYIIMGSLITLFMIIACGCTSVEDEEIQEFEEELNKLSTQNEIQMEEGQKTIVLDKTAEFTIPEGYEVDENTYYDNLLDENTEDEYTTNICFLETDGDYSIAISGWKQSESENMYPDLKESAKNNEGDVEVIKTDAGDAYFYYAGVNDKDQPLELATYIRIGNNTYIIELENSVDEDKVIPNSELEKYKNYIKTIKAYNK